MKTWAEEIWENIYAIVLVAALIWVFLHLFLRAWDIEDRQRSEQLREWREQGRMSDAGNR